MGNWERQWNVMLVLLRCGSAKLQKLTEACEASGSTIRADIAHLSLTFPIKSQRGRNGCYYLSNMYLPFAKHAETLAKLMEIVPAQELSKLDERLLQEAMVALLSIKQNGKTTFSL